MLDWSLSVWVYFIAASMDSLGMAFNTVISILFGSGVVAAVLGLRGRRVDDHALCKRCGYDLSGMKLDMRKWANRVGASCSECGNDLNDILHGVKIGHKAIRKRILNAGVVLLLLSGVLFGLGRLNIDWHEYKPDWWLVQDAKYRWDDDSLDDVRSTLSRRIDESLLSKESMRQLGLSLLAWEEAYEGECPLHNKILISKIYDQGVFNEEEKERYLLFLSECDRVPRLLYFLKNQESVDWLWDALLDRLEDDGAEWHEGWNAVLGELYDNVLSSEEDRDRWAKVVGSHLSLDLPGDLRVDDVGTRQLLIVWDREGSRRGWYTNQEKGQAGHLAFYVEVEKIYMNGELVCDKPMVDYKTLWQQINVFRAKDVGHSYSLMTNFNIGYDTEWKLPICDHAEHVDVMRELLGGDIEVEVVVEMRPYNAVHGNMVRGHEVRLEPVMFRFDESEEEAE